ARFLETHDEPRAAPTFAPGMREAAAIVTFLSPGLRFFHQGQFEGRRKRISPHLVRAPKEGVAARAGRWWSVGVAAAWEGNWTWGGFIAWSWETLSGQRRLVAVNYAGNQGQCYVRLPFPDLAGGSVALRDLMSPASYDRDGGELLSRGLYLDLPPWGYHVFDVTRT